MSLNADHNYPVEDIDGMRLYNIGYKATRETTKAFHIAQVIV